MTVRRQAFDLLLDPSQADALTEVEICPSGVSYVQTRGHGDLNQVQRAVQHLQRGDPGSEIFGNVLLDQLRTLHAKPRLLRDAENTLQLVEQLPHLAGVAQHAAFDIEILAPILEQPVGHVPQKTRGLRHRRVLHCGRDAVVESFDLHPNIAGREHFARDAVGARNGRRVRSGIILGAHREHRSHAIDQAIGDRRRDDLAAQAVALQTHREALLHGRREVTRQFGRQVGVLGNVGMDERTVQPNLAVAQDDGEFGTRQPLAGLAAFGDFLLRRQEFQRAVQISGTLERTDHEGALAQPLLRLELAGTDRLALKIVVAQYQTRHFTRHLHQQAIASRARDFPGAHRAVQQYLQIDLDVRTVHARRVVDEICIERRAARTRCARAAIPPDCRPRRRPCNSVRGRRFAPRHCCGPRHRHDSRTWP